MFPYPTQAVADYIPYSFFTTDAVNAAPDFWYWREELALLADEFDADPFYHRATVESIDRRAWGNLAIAEGDEAIRNMNITQWPREYIGRLVAADSRPAEVRP